MKNNHSLASKIKDLRNRKGFSQEQLAEESKLSLRTVQRIEKGDSIPRGDTLIRLASALNVTPDDLLEREITEDNTYVQLLIWSSAGFLIHPLLGIIIPFVLWITKREKIKFVDNTGKKIINFQITWTLTLYLLLITGTVIFGDGKSFLFNINVTDLILYLTLDPKLPALIFLLLYLFNLLTIFKNIRKYQKGLNNSYFPAIQFLK